MNVSAASSLDRILPDESSPMSPNLEPPRTRLIERGAAALTDAELVSVLLEDGSVPAARALLHRSDGLAGLGCVGSLAPTASPSFREARLSAAVELARRIARDEVPVRQPLSRPGKVAAYLAIQYGRANQEVMGALFVNARHCLIADRELFRGTVHRVAVEPGPILREALLIHATGVILFHTHPSEDPSPSREDLAFTRRIAQAAELMGVELVDHLIVTRGGDWVSLRARDGW